MAKHRAVIIGAGRIGAGYNWPPHPFVYTHADAYLELKDRVELIGFLEPDPARGVAATTKYGLPASGDWRNLELWRPDIVSVCVPPDQQRDALAGLTPIRGDIKGVWCEKPWMGPTGRMLDQGIKFQVNYIRRFDTLHNAVLGKILDGKELGKPLALVVMAKGGLETKCHFDDLSKWWGVALHYVDLPTKDDQNMRGFYTEYVNTEYELICTKGKVRFFQGGMSATLYGVKDSQWFPGSKVPDSLGKICANEPKIFMRVALSNLLDAVEGKAELKSPPY